MSDAPEILLVEHDYPISVEVANALYHEGFQVFRARSVSQALTLAKTYPTLRFIVLDVMLEDYAPFTREQTNDGKMAGLLLLRSLEDILPKAKVYVKTQAPSQEIYDRAQRFESVIYVTSRLEWEDIAAKAKVVYSDGERHPKVLILHGSKLDALEELQEFIRDDLGLGEPTVLMMLPTYRNARTLIENFEYHAPRADLVFALLTGDEEVGGELRPRPNVIFEVGYFFGAFRRNSGRLILLKERGVALPSSMAGIIVVDISNGVRASGERIRNAMGDWWGLRTD